MTRLCWTPACLRAEAISALGSAWAEERCFLTAGGGVTGWRGAGADGTAATGEAGWLLLHPRIVPGADKARSVTAERRGVRRFEDTKGEACGVRAIMEYTLPLRFFEWSSVVDRLPT